jgi:uncharacterized protein (UPF0335 family)
MTRKKKGFGHNSNPVIGERLRTIIGDINRLEDKKREIRDQIKVVKSRAAGEGFDVPTINRIIKLEKMDPYKREEQDALLDIYKAALGMLHDTPLGEAARRRLSPPQPDDTPPVPEEKILPDIDIKGARAMGAEAAGAGKPVTDNPFPARDPRRASWDEAWCAASGSDGMEIPEAFRRQKPEKPEPKEDGEEE